MKQCCETCKYYTSSDEDEVVNDSLQAVFRNGCELHVHARYEYWDAKCEDWTSEEQEAP